MAKTKRSQPKLKEVPTLHMIGAFVVGIVVGSISTFMLLGASAENGRPHVQHYGPHPSPPGGSASRTSMVAVGSPACDEGKWLDARSGVAGECKNYPDDLQLRVVDYTFVGKGFYPGRISSPKCSGHNSFEPHNTTTCIPYLPPVEPVDPFQE